MNTIAPYQPRAPQVARVAQPIPDQPAAEPRLRRVRAGGSMDLHALLTYNATATPHRPQGSQHIDTFA